MTFCPPNSWRTAKTQFRISPLTHHQQSKSHENKKLFQIEPIPFNINSISVVTLVLLWNPQFTPWKAGRTAGSIIYRLLAFKMAFPLSSKKQTLQTQRISSSSSWSQLHWSSEDPDYCLSEIECFESSEEQKKCKTLSIIDCHQFCIEGIFKYTVDQFAWKASLYRVATKFEIVLSTVINGWLVVNSVTWEPLFVSLTRFHPMSYNSFYAVW